MARSTASFLRIRCVLFSGSADHTIRAWDVASGKEKRRYGDEQNDITCLALSPDEKTLTYSTYSSDGIMVHIWDLATNKNLVPPWMAHRSLQVCAIAYSPDSKKVAVGHDAIAIYETATGKRLNPSPESESPIHQVVYSPDGKVLAVGRWWPDPMIELWDTAKGRRVAILRPKSARFESMVFSPDGNYLTTSEGGSIQKKFSAQGFDHEQRKSRCRLVRPADRQLQLALRYQRVRGSCERARRAAVADGFSGRLLSASAGLSSASCGTIGHVEELGQVEEEGQDQGTFAARQSVRLQRTGVPRLNATGRVPCASAGSLGGWVCCLLLLARRMGLLPPRAT
jgi:hypothetical protein